MRVAVLPDFTEENWPSMDLCAEMLETHLSDAKRLVPHFRRVCSRIPSLGKRKSAFNADRLLNRFVLNPQFVKRLRKQYDFFHIVDHSYSHLVHALPAERTGVFCHDLDAFRCLLEPKLDPRPKWFRALTRRIMNGLQKAAMVFHSTLALRREMERHGLIDPARFVHAPYGVSPEFTANGPAETSLGPYILHVGSNIPRKRIDILLRTLAGLRRHFPDLRMVKVGPPFSTEQISIVSQWKLATAIIRREQLARTEIATLYRGAAAVLLPSDAEGFGLPIIEALACGAPVVSSDLPTLREAGGDAVQYVSAGDADAWIGATMRAIENSADSPPLAARLQQATRFTWANHARLIHDAYTRLRARRGAST